MMSCYLQSDLNLTGNKPHQPHITSIRNVRGLLVTMKIVNGLASKKQGNVDRNTAIFSEKFLNLIQGEEISEPTSLYIHIPFSPSQDLSCDHETSVTHDPGRIDRYLDFLEIELDLVSQRSGKCVIGDLHVGGGTPNYLSDTQFVRLITMVESRFDISDAELSLDACATRVSRSQLELLNGLGFTRIQFDVRELDPAVQSAIGRSHSFPMLKDVFDSAREVGFELVCLDLNYGLPGQTVEGIRETVNQFKALSPDRVELLPWSRRPDAYEHQRGIDESEIPSIADKVAMLSVAVDGLEDSGYTWVGLDCFTKKTDVIAEAQRQGQLFRNWNGYTDKQQNLHLGFGVSAVSDLGVLRVRNHKSLTDWEAALSQRCLPIQLGISVSPEEVLERNAIMSLVCNMKLADNGYYKLPDESPALEALATQGVVEKIGGQLKITPQGRFQLNQLWGDSAPQYRWGGF